MADFDAQPGRKAPLPPALSPTQREADEAELYAGLRGVAGIVAGAQGVIDLLRDVAEFAEHAVQLGSQFAKPAAVSVYNAQLLANAHERTLRLQRALDSRSVIDQAIGIIRSRSGGSADEAFERLIHISQTENVKLHAVAERLVEEAVRRARARRHWTR
ncbi:MAG TPA: ANTAR domain-containing protein [Mycobacterium sp.]|nr:ANTAR domain-containing protein [Mycobacterium sp.]